MAERDKIKGDHQDIVLEGPDVGGETFGEYLRRERELRQISLQEVAEGTKIAIHMLKAMEADQWEKLPAELFIKGFVKSYAEFIGLVPEEVLLRYQQAKAEEGMVGASSQQGAVPNQLISTKPGSSKGSLSKFWWLALLLVAGLAAAGYYFWFYVK